MYEVDVLYLPFVIDMEFVGKVNGMLRGKVLYLLTPNRYTLDGTRMQGRKFIPVTVTEVVPGNTDFPLRVLFTEDNAADTCAMLMSAGAGKLSSRNFRTASCKPSTNLALYST